MADSFSMTAITGPARDRLAQLGRDMDGAIKDGIRESGRKAASAAKRNVRVFGGGKATGSAVHIRTVKKARRAGVNLAGGKLGKGESVEGTNQVVVGLLRDSIAAGRPTEYNGTYSLKVYPGGPKAHLYAAKIENLDHYMARALAEVSPLIPNIHSDALARVLNG